MNKCDVIDVLLLPLPLLDNFIIICNENGQMKVQPIDYDSLDKRICYINSSDKLVVFKYQLKVLGDTGYNSIAWTTLENWNNRLTTKFDSSLVGELHHYDREIWHVEGGKKYLYNRKIWNFEYAKKYLVELGFLSENIIDKTQNCFGELGIVQY